ncbi:MAG TPA: hypothetical protein VKB69_02735 [Micromonosporaceae bacterium]|nr:hypothetical protein [Micromonosporaceae bacterium]
MSIEGLTRELLVRYLDSWVPAALHARRATFVQVWSRAVDVEAAEAAVRVFAEFADQLRRRSATLVFVAPELADIDSRTRALQRELGTPAELGVHALAGDASRLPAALSAARAAGAPLLVVVDTDGDVDEDALAGALRVGKPGEALVTGPLSLSRPAIGPPLSCRVDFVAGDDERRICFTTGQAGHLDAFKDALWQLDEYAGVAIRDPNDTAGRLMDIALDPPLGPLRRELAAHLASAGPRTVTELRHFALTDTVYRASDATKAVTAMLTSGAVTREPPHGRLGGDVLIRVRRP